MNIKLDETSGQIKTPNRAQDVNAILHRIEPHSVTSLDLCVWVKEGMWKVSMAFSTCR